MVTDQAVDHHPKEIPPDMLLKLDLMTDTKLTIGGIWGQVESGQTWLANDGRRLVLSADSMFVFYLLESNDPSVLRKVYCQSARGFIGEVTTYPLIEGARRAAPMARLAEYEMQFLIGVCSCVSGVGLAAVITTDALKFVVENRSKFGKWSLACAAAISARATLKQHAPTLYDKVFDAALAGLLSGMLISLKNVPAAAAADPKIAGRGVGVLVGKIGKNAMAGRISAVSIVLTVLWTVLSKSLSALPKAVALTASDKIASAQEMVNALRKSNINISQNEALKIIDEVTRNWRPIKDELHKLQEAFKSAQ